MNKELEDELKHALGDTFLFYIKAHGFHWNVEGPNFTEYHSFFETLYKDAWEAVDLIAEHIRTLNVYCPGSASRLSELGTIEDTTEVPDAFTMCKKLEEANEKVIQSLTTAQEKADADRKVGISNFLQDRIDIHEKHGWMLRSLVAH